MTDKLIILGATGRLGSQLCQAGRQFGLEVTAVPQSKYRNWDSASPAGEYFDEIGLDETSAVVSAFGIINPNDDRAKIEEANFSLPVTICEAAASFGATAVTLGTVLEEAIPKEKQNAYVQAKTKLAGASQGKWLHLRLHTVYGGRAPDGFMFTGQMLSAINRNLRFSMTSGRQVREYHHVEDAANAILVAASRNRKGCLDISHGDAISLRELAEAVFRHYGKEHLLGVGDLASPEVEAFQPLYTKPAYLHDCGSRDTVPAIISWLDLFVRG